MTEISLKGVCFSYSRFSETPLLSCPELIIPPGSRVALVGDVGAGKSTLLKLMSGIVKPDKGFIKVNGRVFNGLARLRGFSNFSTLYENLLFLGMMNGGSLTEVNESIKYYGQVYGFNHALGELYSSLSSSLRHRVVQAIPVLSNFDVYFFEGLPLGNSKILGDQYDLLWRKITSNVDSIIICSVLNQKMIEKHFTHIINIDGSQVRLNQLN